MTPDTHSQNCDVHIPVVQPDVPIHRLPEDILYRIFIDYVEASGPRECCGSTHLALAPKHYGVGCDRKQIRAFERCRFGLLRVCRAWRQIASRIPQLWSTFYYSSKDVVSHHLDRCKNIMLDVCWHAGEEDPKALVLLLKQFSRVRTLELEVPISVHTLLAEKFWSKPRPAPCLESVRFILARPTTMDDCPFHNVIDYVELPTYLDECDMPNLQEVVISGYKLSNWSTRLFSPTLTRLVITCHNYPGQMPPNSFSLEAGLDTLRRMPLLTELVLGSCLYSERGTISSLPAVDEGDLIILSQLRYFSIACDARDCAYFISHLVIPACTTISIKSEDDGGEMEMRNFCRAALAKIYDSQAIEGKRPILRGAFLASTGEQHECLCVSTSPRDSGCFMDEFGEEPSYNTFSFRVVLETANVDILTEELFVNLPLSEVETFSVESCCLGELAPMAIMSLVERMPLVSTIQVFDCNSNGSIHTMLMAHTKQPRDGTRHFLLPKLRKLEIEVEGPYIPEESEINRDWCIGLMYVLRERYKAGYPLDTLSYDRGAKTIMAQSTEALTLGRVRWIRDRVVDKWAIADDDMTAIKDLGRGAVSNVDVGPVMPFPDSWFGEGIACNLKEIYGPDPFGLDLVPEATVPSVTEKSSPL